MNETLCIAIPVIITEIYDGASALFENLNLSKQEWTGFKNIPGNNLSLAPRDSLGDLKSNFHFYSLQKIEEFCRTMCKKKVPGDQNN